MLYKDQTASDEIKALKEGIEGKNTLMTAHSAGLRLPEGKNENYQNDLTFFEPGSIIPSVCGVNIDPTAAHTLQI